MFRKGAVFIFLGLLIVLPSLPIFAEHFFRVHDFLHAARTAEMARALSDGQLPPRWSQNFAYGYGMPLFQFYAPLPSFVSALLVLAGVSLLTAVRVLFFFPAVATVVGCFYLGKRLFGTLEGLFLAALFTLAPYRAVDLYVRGSVSELWALASYPWILLFLFELFNQKKWAVVGLSLSLSVLFLSHNISALLFAPVVVSFCVLKLWSLRKQRQQFFQLLLLVSVAAGLSLLMSSFYLLPAYFEKSATQVAERSTEGYFAFENHFVGVRQLFAPNWGYGGSVPGPADDISFFIGYPQLAVLFVATLAVGALIARRKNFLLLHFLKNKPAVTLMVLFFVMTAGAYTMTTRFSAVLWDLLPLFKYVQFPWRWLGVGAFLGACLGAGLLYLLASQRVKLALVGLGGLLLFVLHWNFFQPEQYLTDASQYYFSDTNRIRSEISPVLPDYFPKQFSAEGVVIEPVWLESGSGEITEIQSNSHQVVAKVIVAEPASVVLAVADFPGWEVLIDGKPTSHATDSSGLIAFQLDPGSYQLKASFTDTPLRQTADFLSQAGVLLLLGYCVYAQWGNKTK